MLSIGKILKKSLSDFMNVLKNPTVMVIFGVSVAVAFIPQISQIIFKQNFKITIISLVLMFLLIMYLQVVKVKMVANIIKGETEYKIFSGTFSRYIELLIKTIIYCVLLYGAFLFSFLILLWIFIMPEIVFIGLLSRISREAAAGGGAIIAFIMIFISLIFVLMIGSIRASQYSNLIILENEKSPLKKSFKMTKKSFWHIVLIYMIIGAIMSPLMILNGIMPFLFEKHEIYGLLLTSPFTLLFSVMITTITLNVYFELKKDKTN